MEIKIPVGLLFYYLFLVSGFKILIAFTGNSFYRGYGYKYTLLIFVLMLILPLLLFVKRMGSKIPQTTSRGLGGTMGDSSVLFVCLALFFFSPMCLILLLVPVTIVGMFLPLIAIINCLGG